MLEGGGVGHGWYRVEYLYNAGDARPLNGSEVFLERPDLCRFIIRDENEGAQASIESLVESFVFLPVGVGREPLANHQLLELQVREPEGRGMGLCESGFCGCNVKLVDEVGVGPSAWIHQRDVGVIGAQPKDEFIGDGPGREGVVRNPAFDCHDFPDVDGPITKAGDKKNSLVPQEFGSSLFHVEELFGGSYFDSPDLLRSVEVLHRASAEGVTEFVDGIRVDTKDAWLGGVVSQVFGDPNEVAWEVATVGCCSDREFFATSNRDAGVCSRSVVVEILDHADRVSDFAEEGRGAGCRNRLAVGFSALLRLGGISYHDNPRRSGFGVVSSLHREGEIQKRFEKNFAFPARLPNGSGRCKFCTPLA